MSYQDLVYCRNEDSNGLSDWLWIKGETGVWEGPTENWPEHIKLWLSHVRNRRVVVQAGGACGMYPRLFSSIFERVYTFEPDPLSFHCLVNNCQTDNVIKLNAALGEENRLIQLDRSNKTNVGMHKIDQGATGFIPMLTIDNLNLDACDLIQLDIEGYEYGALAGAFMTISQFKPVISCENGSSKILDFLSPLGYRQVGTSHADTTYAC
jgi:FkbM family methyltransferase